MKILIVLLLLLPGVAAAQLLPEALGEFERKTVEAYQPGDAQVFQEFGFERAEEAHYADKNGSSLDITAERFADDTGAFAAFQWQQPDNAVPVSFGERALRSGNKTLIHFGNYLVQMEGAKPVDDNVELMLAYLPRVQMTPDPPVTEHVPADGLVKQSQRHILGPVTLQKLAPEVPPSVAAFRYGTEAQYARYQTPSGEMRLVLFSYPSSQIARGQYEEFSKLDTGMSRRVRSMVAFVPSPKSRDEAELLLSKVQYTIDVTMTPQATNGRHDNLGNLILDVMLLALVLIVLMIVGGVLVAGARLAAGKFAPDSILAQQDGAELTRLNIDNFPKS